MFKNTYQNGLLSIFYSCGSNPLSIWDTNVQNGHIKRLTDSEINSLVLELVSTNVSTTYMKCPRKNAVLGIKLPFLVVILKNLKKYFSFEIVILDDSNCRRRFKVSNFQSTTKVKPFCTSMPVDLSDGWNQIQFNLADFTHRAYGTQYIEALQVEVHANTRLRRIYFSDRLYTEEELPQEYKLFLPMTIKEKKGIKIVKEAKLEKFKQAQPKKGAEEKKESLEGEEASKKKKEDDEIFKDPTGTPADPADVDADNTEVQTEGDTKDGVDNAAGVTPEVKEPSAAEEQQTESGINERAPENIETRELADEITGDPAAVTNEAAEVVE